VSAVAVARATLASCRSVSLVYGTDESRVTALADVELEVGTGDTVALWGPSGSGKTTLLHLLGGLVTPTHGRVEWHGEPLSSLDAAARGRRRAEGIAYVFQGANLLPHLNVYENVAFALRAALLGGPPLSGARGAEPTVEDLLTLVGLADKLDSLPSELSGGEMQRVAIARALAQRPELLLCDEPTGHLDTDTGARVLNLIDALQEEFGFALITATHDVDVAARYDRVVELRDGRIVGEEDRR
jgi:ABC-type lipoprotein export system ATPase subunit